MSDEKTETIYCTHLDSLVVDPSYVLWLGDHRRVFLCEDCYKIMAYDVIHRFAFETSRPPTIYGRTFGR